MKCHLGLKEHICFFYGRRELVNCIVASGFKVKGEVKSLEYFGKTNILYLRNCIFLLKA